MSQMTDPGPSSTIASMVASAISRSARSQETRFQRPSPRAPTRSSGWSTLDAATERAL
jgi:hypothetical protein